MDTGSALEGFIEQLRADRSAFTAHEEATCQGVVLPLLARLGWDRDNVREVAPQFKVDGGRVDYCLKVGDKPGVFIEVKRSTEELEQHERQLLEYAFQQSVEIAILTNGFLWWFYLPRLEVPWQERKFLTIDIEERDPEQSAKHLVESLSKESIVSGSAPKRAREIRESSEKERVIRQTIPVAWGRLLSEHDERLLQVLADKVESLCGHRPNAELLVDHLKHLVGVEEAPPPRHRTPESLPRRTNGRVSRSHPEDYANRKPVGYAFLGNSHSVPTFKAVLMGICNDLYQHHRQEFNRILELRGPRRQYFSRDRQGMIDPREITGTGIYVETNLNANNLVDVCHKLLRHFGHSSNEFQIHLSEE